MYRGLLIIGLALALGARWYVTRNFFEAGVYKNPEVRFTVTFPSTWREISTPRGADFAAGLSSTELCSVNLLSPPNPELVRAKLSAAIDRVIASDHGKKEPQEISVHGLKAYRVEGKKILVVAVLLPKTAVLLQCLAPHERFSELRDQFEQVGMSIQAF